MKSTVFIANEINKLFNVIREKKSQNIDDGQIKEIEELKLKCMSDNVHECLLSCQTFVKLADDGVLNGAFVLAIFMSMLPGASSHQFTALTEGIVELLLQELRKRVLMKPNEKYICPFGIRPPQHPLIMLLQKDERNMNNLSNKINWICNHHDKEVSNNSIEFLRPVYLYVFCNPAPIPDSKTLWVPLLQLTEKSKEAHGLVIDILSWMRFNSSANCILNNILVMEAVEHFPKQANNQILIELVLYLASQLPHLCEFGYDPRSSLNLIETIIYKLGDSDSSYQNLLLLILGQALHVISPIYFLDLLRILKLVIIEQNFGNTIILYITVDALLQWISHPSFVSSLFINEIKTLIDFIVSDQHKIKSAKINTKLISGPFKFFNAKIAIYYDICVLLEKWAATNDPNVINNFVVNLKNAHKSYILKISLLLRALFLSNELDAERWKVVHEILLNLIKTDEHLASVFLMPYLYKLARETDSKLNVVLLNGICDFAVVKENVPLILNTLKALSQRHMTSFYLNLHLKLWKIEPRTYSFLYKILSDPVKDNGWEIQIARANTIKDVCTINSTLHGKDLIAIVSEILNTCTDKYGDIATSLSLETISILCESHIINIVSTWKALSGKFKNEKRVKVIKRLCHFFGLVPKLPSPTLDYETLVVECTEKLWSYVINYNDPEIIAASLDALRNYDFNEMQLKHIPSVFRQKLGIPATLIKTPVDAKKDPLEILTYIPGECWLQLLKTINQAALNDAGDLIGHIIYKEIEKYRGGVYTLQEGRPEPNDLKSLPAKSALKYVVHSVIQLSQQNRPDDLIYLEQCLRILAKKFPKPIPPLNWCFLHEIFHINNAIKKYCIEIALHQSITSGTAKRFVENYLSEYNPFKATFEDNQNLLDVFSDLCAFLDENIYLAFITKWFSYIFERSINDEKNDHFIKTLSTICTIFNGKVKNDLNKNSIIEMTTNYLENIDLEHKYFNYYVETICTFPSDSIDGFSSPNTWWEIDVTKLRKSTILRCKLVQMNKAAFDNPLNWLNPIIDAYAKLKSEHNFLFKSLAKTFFDYHDDRNSCNWALEILGQIQTILTNETDIDVDRCNFLCDIFVIGVILFSGVACTFLKVDNVATSRQNRLNMFPQGLYLLCENSVWDTNSVKIFEFLYYMLINPAIPAFFKETFKYALINSKHHKYFAQKEYWCKYVCQKH